MQKRPIYKAFREKMKRTSNRHIVSITGPVMCKDYKKDIFAVFAYDFEPSHNFQVLEKSMFYASFPTIAPGLGGSDFTALLRAFGDREI